MIIRDRRQPFKGNSFIVQVVIRFRRESVMYTSKVVVAIIFLATLLLNWPLALWSRRSDHTANHGKALLGNAGNQDGEVSWLKELSVPNSNRNIKNKGHVVSLWNCRGLYCRMWISRFWVHTKIPYQYLILQFISRWFYQVKRLALDSERLELDINLRLFCCCR